MRLFNVQESFLVIFNNRFELYLILANVTIFIRLNRTSQNLRYGNTVRNAILDEKIVLNMTGVNEYQGRAVLLR